MAIVIKALILCNTDNPAEALNGAFVSLNAGAFESRNPILDFALGVEQAISIDSDYQDGEFVAQVPGVEHLRTANELLMETP